jgi:hypothetical protein
MLVDVLNAATRRDITTKPHCDPTARTHEGRATTELGNRKWERLALILAEKSSTRVASTPRQGRKFTLDPISLPPYSTLGHCSAEEEARGLDKRVEGWFIQ